MEGREGRESRGGRERGRLHSEEVVRQNRAGHVGGGLQWAIRRGRRRKGGREVPGRPEVSFEAREVWGTVGAEICVCLVFVRVPRGTI